MKSGTAVCISSTNSFQYIYPCELNPTTGDEILEVHISESNLRLTWIIEVSHKFYSNGNYSTTSWKTLKLLECPYQDTSGKFEISENYTSHSITGKFDSDSIPCISNLENIIECRNDRNSFITIKFTIYLKDHLNKFNANMFENYYKFLLSDKLSDVKFTFDEEEIPAHKVILSAQSEIFACMFESDMMERNKNKVEITDIEQSTFKELLKFIYCGSIDCINVENLLKLIIAADKYAINGLISICEQRISNNLSNDNVIDVLVIADLIKLNKLKKNCIDLIVKNKNEIIITKGYKELVQSNRSDLLSEIICSPLLKFSSTNLSSATGQVIVLPKVDQVQVQKNPQILPVAKASENFKRLLAVTDTNRIDHSYHNYIAESLMHQFSTRSLWAHGIEIIQENLIPCAKIFSAISFYIVPVATIGLLRIYILALSR